MIIVPLTQNQIALVDECDADLASLNWFAHYQKHTNSYYAGRNVRGHIHYMHRVVAVRMLDRELIDGEEVDHIHHVTTDNRRNELRVVSRAINAQNSSVYTSNTSGYKGVSWDKVNLKYKVEVQRFRKRIYIGRYTLLEEAVQAYNKFIDEELT